MWRSLSLYQPNLCARRIKGHSATAPAIAPAPPLPMWENRRRTCLPCHLCLIDSKRAGVHSPSKQIEMWCCQGSASLGTVSFLFWMQARRTHSSSDFSRKSLARAPRFLSCSMRASASRCQMPCQLSEYLCDFPMSAKVKSTKDQKTWPDQAGVN